MLPCFGKGMEHNQDSFNESVSSILERKVRGWLSGVIEDMRRSSPVQQWLDSLPTDPRTDTDVTHKSLTVTTTNANEDNNGSTTDDKPVDSDTKSEENKAEDSITENTVVEADCGKNEVKAENGDGDYDDKTLEVPIEREAWKRKSLDSCVLTNTPQVRKVKNKLQRDHSIQSEGCSPRFKNPLFRDHSLQSDASGSSGSSVLNVLGARKVDAESVLLALGFGPSEKQQKLQRIPDRFLVPSKLQGISTEQFIKDEHHSMRMHDCGVFGYRGLTGNPHVPPSTIVAKIMECILHDDVCREEAFMKTRHSIADMRSAPVIHAHLAARLRST